MASDLMLVNRVYTEVRTWVALNSMQIHSETTQPTVPDFEPHYIDVLMVVAMLLDNPKLAQEIVDETWKEYP